MAAGDLIEFGKLLGAGLAMGLGAIGPGIGIGILGAGFEGVLEDKRLHRLVFHGPEGSFSILPIAEAGAAFLHDPSLIAPSIITLKIGTAGTIGTDYGRRRTFL